MLVEKYVWSHYNRMNTYYFTWEVKPESDESLIGFTILDCCLLPFTLLFWWWPKKESCKGKIRNIRCCSCSILEPVLDLDIRLGIPYLLFHTFRQNFQKTDNNLSCVAMVARVFIQKRSYNKARPRIGAFLIKTLTTMRVAASESNTTELIKKLSF